MRCAYRRSHFFLNFGVSPTYSLLDDQTWAALRHHFLDCTILWTPQIEGRYQALSEALRHTDMEPSQET